MFSCLFFFLINREVFNASLFFLKLINLFVTLPYSMQTSPTRDQTYTPSVQAQRPKQWNRQEVPLAFF